MLDDFLLKLSTHKVNASRVCNMYFGANDENIQRLNNLRAYLKYFLLHQPNIILIGEAPGYKGCRQSGVPFTSTKIFASSPFFTDLQVKTGRYQSEATASIIWSYLDGMKKYPLFWNAYPFHPFQNGNQHTNRKPLVNELHEGKVYIELMIKMFPGAKLLAVGGVAHGALQTIGYNSVRIRHPSYGGKEEFCRSMNVHLTTR